MTDKKTDDLAERLARRASRHLVSMEEKETFSVSKGLSFWGAVGWNIPLPTVSGAILGRWLDQHYAHSSISWSINLIILGLIIGMFSMGYWLNKEGIKRTAAMQAERNAKITQAQEMSLAAKDEDEENDDDEMYNDGGDCV